MPIKLTDKNYDAEVLNTEQTVLIDFYADWCAPCKMLSPIFDEVESEVEDVKICKVNIDDEPMLAQKFQVKSIPTLVVIKNGETVSASSGFRNKKAVLNMLI